MAAVIFTCLAYFIPFLVVTGAISLDQNLWETGFHADAVEIIAGKWLKAWLEIGVVLSAIGLFEAQLSSSAYQVLRMADIGFLPKFCSFCSKKFKTSFVGILVSTIIVLAISYMRLTVKISSANFLFSLGMLLEFASFVWLRRKMPSLKRPYKVPMGLPGLIIISDICDGNCHKDWFLVSGIMTVAGIDWFFFMRFCKSKKLLKFNENEEIHEGSPFG